YGLLDITSFVLAADGKSATVGYTYTLSDNVLTPPAGIDYFDDIGNGITVTGVSGASSASVDLQIRIIDDTPLAVNDAGGTVTEDGAGSLGGNVLDNDEAGADKPAVFVSWGADAAAVAALNSYGTLVRDPSTGDWSYVLDNSRPATQALGASFNQTYTLNYTMADADGDQSTATLTITVKGAGDSQTVTAQAAGGATTTVYETALVDGRTELSDPAVNSDTREAVSGTFQVSATDGVASVTVLGQTFVPGGP
ncbi:VCBS domain-containing protein, partial [Escherichia coli]